jgi:hypothetical protein
VVAFAGGFVGLLPLLAIDLLQYSQHWQAADLFRAAPMVGPNPLCHGARCAVMGFLVLPTVILIILLACLMRSGNASVAMLLPGVITLPLCGLVACLNGKGVPLSMPTEEAQSAGRGVIMIGVMMISMIVSGLAAWAWSEGWFGWSLAVETLITTALYLRIQRSLASAHWRRLE